MVALAYGPRTEGSCSRAHAHALRACAEEGLKARPSPAWGDGMMPHIRTVCASCQGVLDGSRGGRPAIAQLR